MRTSPTVIHNGAVIRGGFGGALLSQQFEHGVDGKCVDVCHSRNYRFFCSICLVK